MPQMYGYGAPIIREDIGAMLHTWRAASELVSKSVDAERYAYAEARVVDYLRDCETFGSLLSAYFTPNWRLTHLLAELCTQGAIVLRPYRLLGASCALRLHELIDA